MINEELFLIFWIPGFLLLLFGWYMQKVDYKGLWFVPWGVGMYLLGTSLGILIC